MNNLPVAENKLLKRWCLPWKPDRPAHWISQELAMYDPQFPPDITSLEMPLSYFSAAQAVPPQIGYNLRSLVYCSVRYGITLVDSSAPVQAVEGVDQSAEGAAAVDNSEDAKERYVSRLPCFAHLEL